jgi:preprotein translocase subunit YajC
MDFLMSPAFAQAAGPAPSPWSPLIMLAIFFAVFFFLVIRPQMKRSKEHRSLIGALAKGDEVITSGGVAGRIDAVSESFITVEIAEGVKVKVQKQAVTAVLPKGTLKSA